MGCRWTGHAPCRQGPLPRPSVSFLSPLRRKCMDSCVTARLTVLLCPRGFPTPAPHFVNPVMWLRSVCMSAVLVWGPGCQTSQNWKCLWENSVRFCCLVGQTLRECRGASPLGQGAQGASVLCPHVICHQWDDGGVVLGIMLGERSRAVV